MRNSAELAQHVERLGYKRFWRVEHHSMPGIASAATAVALAFVGSKTSTIRIGAGGIMLSVQPCAPEPVGGTWIAPSCG